MYRSDKNTGIIDPIVEIPTKCFATQTRVRNIGSNNIIYISETVTQLFESLLIKREIK